MLAFSAPPASGTSAIARMLGLDAPVALVATLAAMVLVPLTAPLLAQYFSHGISVAISTRSLALRLAFLIGSAEGPRSSCAYERCAFTIRANSST